MVRKLIVEGDTDQAFIWALLLQMAKSTGILCETENKKSNESTWRMNFGEIPVEVIKTGGYANFHNSRQEFEDQINGDDVKIYFIFDADKTTDKDGGIKKRKEYIQKRWGKIEFNRPPLSVDFFFFPNNQDDGAIENLLESMAKVEHKQLYTNAIDVYQKKVDSLLNPQSSSGHYCPISQKTRVQLYAEAVDAKIKRNAGFKDSFEKSQDLWDWNSPHLQPLKDFLNEKVLLQESAGTQNGGNENQK